MSAAAREPPKSSRRRGKRGRVNGEQVPEKRRGGSASAAGGSSAVQQQTYPFSRAAMWVCTFAVLCGGFSFAVALRGPLWGGAAQGRSPIDGKLVGEKARRRGPGWEVVAEYPHDATAFTQGLLVYEGRLLESTGEYGRSGVREVDLTTGAVVTSSLIAGESHFGEGIAVTNRTIHQLTWRSRVAFTYDADTLAPLGTYEFETPTREGWGMASDGAGHLVVSDGSEWLCFWDPETLTEVRRISVRNEAGLPWKLLNELEFYRGHLLANVWMRDIILRIDPTDGSVLRVYDLRELYPRELRRAEQVTSADAVLNGIAFDESNGALYLTGKLWPRLYHVFLDEPPVSENDAL